MRAKQCYQMWFPTRGNRGNVTPPNKEETLQMLRWFSQNRNNPAQTIYELDVAMWYGALVSGTSQMTTLLHRVFTVIYYGGLMYRANNTTWKTWASTDIPVASALSHGNRMIIQLPKASRTLNGKDHTFWNWLRAGVKPLPGLGQKFGSHGIDTSATPEAIGLGRKKYIKEKHGGNPIGKGVIAVSEAGNHYRFNIPLGGEGNYNPWTGNQITSDGRHGHLYVYYCSPSATHYGAVMIGCESEGPGVVGQTWHKHTAKAGSEEFTATGGPRWIVNKSEGKKGYVPLGTVDLAGKYDATIIDLIGDGGLIDLKRVMNAEFSPDDLVETAKPPTPITPQLVTVIPPLKTWQQSSSASGKRSAAGLTGIDALVEEYHRNLKRFSLQKRKQVLNVMLDATAYWLDQTKNKRSRRRFGVQRLGELIVQELLSLR